MGGGSPKLPRAKQRWRCIYGSLDRILVFWVCPSVLVLFGRSSWLKNWACDRHVFFCFRRHRRGRATLCYGLRRRRGCCPGRHSLRFTMYGLSRGCRQSPNSRWTASETLVQCEHAKLDELEITFDPLHKISIFGCCTAFVSWIESNFPRPPQDENAFLVPFLTNQNQIQFKSNFKSCQKFN